MKSKNTLNNNDSTSLANKNLPKQIIQDLDEPIQGNHYPIKFFELKTYNSTEFPLEADKDKYFALIKGKEFSLKQIDIKFKKVFDANVDKDTLKDKSGTEAFFQSKEKDTVLFIAKNQKEIPIRSGLKSLKIQKVIKPGDKFEYEFEGIKYQLYAIGDANKDKKLKYPFVNYKLYFTAEVEGKKIGQTIIEKMYFDDKLPQIIFAGDIDGDQKLDFLINTSFEKDAQNPTLFLSKTAPTGSLLQVAGMKLTNTGF